MRTPRISDWSSSPATRCSARILFEFEHNKIVNILIRQFPRRRQSSDPRTHDRDLNRLPIVRRDIETSTLAQNVTEVDVLPDDLTVRKFTGATLPTRRHRDRRAE